MTTTLKDLAAKPMFGAENIGNRLILILRELGWSYRYLGKMSGVSMHTIKTWTQRQAKSVRPESVEAIAKATGYNYQWIATGEGPKRPDLPLQRPVEPAYAPAPVAAPSSEYLNLRDIYARNLQDIKDGLARIEAMLDECHRLHNPHRIEQEAGGAERQGRRRAGGDSS